MIFKFNVEDFKASYVLKDITKKFNGNVVLDNISLEMPEKGILVISGYSGIGKTTFLRIMANLIAPDSGERIGFDNKRIAYLFQEDRLLPWFDLLKNITCVLQGEDKEQKAKYWLDQVGLANQYAKYPSELSGGMKRRAALARMFAFGGDLYILDEPFKGLDKELKDRIIEITKNACKGKMLVVVTHDKQEEDLLLK
ncbi:MAG TPA: ABC transporter ATP-binding protein [Clostridiaceae bacterium]|nr:ABC transporter ATP-binding protein [Clostridiaceae bacterium]